MFSERSPQPIGGGGRVTEGGSAAGAGVHGGVDVPVQTVGGVHDARRLGEVVAAHDDGDADLGILICGTGIGISLAANKVPGIRAAVCSEPFSARLSRQHNDSNILAFGSRVIGPGTALDIVDAWLDASFEGGRHQRRVDLIENSEND